MPKLNQDWKYPTQTTQVQCNAVPNNNTTANISIGSDESNTSKRYHGDQLVLNSVYS